MDINRYVKWLKPPVFLLSLGPVAVLAYKAYHDTQFPDAVPLLSGNPQAFIRNSTGFWTLVFICITIGITPVRRLLHQNWLVRFRRMMGLFAFFYGSLHFVTYFLFDTGLDWGAVVKDVYHAPVHHGGLHRLAADGAAGDHVHGGLGAPSGRKTLAEAALFGLRHGDRRGAALLVAGEGGYHRAAALCGDRRAIPRLPDRGVCPEEEKRGRRGTSPAPQKRLPAKARAE